MNATHAKLCKRFVWQILSLTTCLLVLESSAHAAYVSTGWLSALQIHMDNGVTYLTGEFTTTGTCQNDRLEIRDSGDYFGSVENGKRMYALILSARMQEKRIRLGYNDADGSSCRVAEVWIEW